VPEQETFKDYPIADLHPTMMAAIAKGGQCYMKFTCDYCGSRQTIDTPNLLFTQGKCEECNSVTDLARKGGNLLIVYKTKWDKNV